MREALDTVGFSRSTLLDASLIRESMVAPYETATRILGEAPLFVERQTIRVLAGGRSIASTPIEAPFHTDSQMILGVPATVQILICVTAAASGGETVLVDAFPIIERLNDASLFDADVTQRFYFGDVHGPIVALRGGHLTVTMSPATAGRFRSEVARTPPTLVSLSAGDVLVASNHRMVHGRTAFDPADGRELVRLLVWLERPLFAPPSLVKRAREVASDALTSTRIKAVTRLLRGSPPSRIASELGLTESELYALRDRCLSSLV